MDCLASSRRFAMVCKRAEEREGGERKREGGRK